MNSRRRSKRKSKQTDGKDIRAIADSVLENHQQIRSKPRQYSLLPCLRAGSHRWWLPCDSSNALLLAEIILTNRRHHSGVDDTGLINRVKRTLEKNPPLFIFSAFHFTSQSRDTDSYSLNDLAAWLLNNLASCLMHGDDLLGSPEISQDLCARWSRLHSYFLTIPIATWLEQSHLWLELTGPPISTKNRRQWRGYIGDEDSREVDQLDSYQCPANTLLERLSRTQQQLFTLETDFDKQLAASKSDAIKQLAYGLSHEINNPLANISARAQQLQRDEPDPTRSASLQRISDQVYRAHEMIADLMFYANPPSKEQQDTDLGMIAEETVSKYQDEASRRSIEINIKIKADQLLTDSGEPPTFPQNNQPAQQLFAVVDPGMIREAIGALIRNAIEAISDEGKIQISIHRTESSLIIEVADSGPGLSEQARKNAFDPYFSGREAGRGLGLGLCRVSRIAELHGGTAEVIGSIVGCIARITLPR